jgi:hypothetical protein
MKNFNKSLKSITSDLIELNEAKKRNSANIEDEYFDQFD